MYSINFTENNTKFCLSLRYNRANSYLFVTGVEIIKLKAEGSKILTTSLSLGSISREYERNRYHNMSEEKKQMLKEYQKDYRESNVTKKFWFLVKQYINSFWVLWI